MLFGTNQLNWCEGLQSSILEHTEIPKHHGIRSDVFNCLIDPEMNTFQTGDDRLLGFEKLLGDGFIFWHFCLRVGSSIRESGSSGRSRVTAGWL